VVVDGDELEPGEVVLLHVGAANRDPAFAADPDECVIGRTLPRPHLTFGYGIHFCLGAALARAEICIAVETLLARLVGLRTVADQVVEQTPAYIFRGPQRYLVDYDHRRDR
jgi:cytochrome P450